MTGIIASSSIAQPVVNRCKQTSEDTLTACEFGARDSYWLALGKCRAGSYSNCLETKEFSSLEPDVIEYKFYAPGVGNIQTVGPITGNHLDLTGFTRPPGPEGLRRLRRKNPHRPLLSFSNRV